MPKFMNLVVYFASPLAVTADAGQTVTVDTIMSILQAVTSVMSIEAIVGFLAGLIVAAMSYVFLWWGVRKGFRMIYKAVTKGKISV